jgi:hypothetical protein
LASSGVVSDWELTSPRGAPVPLTTVLFTVFEQESSDLQGGDELQKYVKTCKSLFYDPSVESPVDKSSRERHTGILPLRIQGYSHYNTSEQLVWNASTVCPKRCG